MSVRGVKNQRRVISVCKCNATVTTNLETSHAYHIPCEIPSVTMVASSTIWVILVVVTMAAVIAVVGMLGVLSGIGIKVLADASTNAFAVMPALEFFVSTPLEEFSR